jgi:hypothetical protein
VKTLQERRHQNPLRIGDKISEGVSACIHATNSKPKSSYKKPHKGRGLWKLGNPSNSEKESAKSSRGETLANGSTDRI